MPDLPITIKRIRSSRRLKLRILQNGEIIVTAHPLVPKVLIDNFIAEHLEWIAENSAKILANKKDLTENRSSVFFRGKEISLKLRVNAGLKEEVVLSHDSITVTASAEDHKVVRDILEKWYRAQAKKHFEQRVPLLADLMGHDVMRVTIRDQRSRWGSCSSRQNISLNWRLIQAPDWVSDYVVYHELSHLQQMNHSRAFWNLVATYVPNYKDAEKWLKDHHRLLHF